MSSRRNKAGKIDDVILQAGPVITTIAKLHQRILERFDNKPTGLYRVCGQLLTIAKNDRALVERLSRPYVLMRLGLGLVMAVTIVTLAVVLFLIPFMVADLTHPTSGESATVQLFLGIEAAVQLVIFVVAWIGLLPGAEGYFKRRRALPALRKLRSIIHVIDMHQLAKDPSKFVVGTPGSAEGSTQSSPAFELSEYQMTRYLDYCSEMLSLTAKVAALFGQVVNDRQVSEMVSDVERLSSGLSQKIWQKIVILQQLKEGEVGNKVPVSLPGIRPGDAHAPPSAPVSP